MRMGRVAHRPGANEELDERIIAEALIEEQISSEQGQVTSGLWLGGSHSTLATGHSSLPLSDEFRHK